MNTLKERKPGEAWFLTLMVGGSAFLLWRAVGISGLQSWSSAGMFPMLAAATMLVTGLMAMVQMLRRPPERRGGFAAFVAQIAPVRLIGGVGAVAAYMLLLPFLGFLAASLFFMVSAMRLFGSRRWTLNIGVSVASLAAIYLVFSTVFSVVLPKGLWLSGLLPW